MVATPSAKASATSKASALQRPVQPSAELAAVIEPERCSRGKAATKVWAYIKAHNLQSPVNRREIRADDRLRKVFGKDSVTMFEMSKPPANHPT